MTITFPSDTYIARKDEDGATYCARCAEARCVIDGEMRDWFVDGDAPLLRCSVCGREGGE